MSQELHASCVMASLNAILFAELYAPQIFGRYSTEVIYFYRQFWMSIPSSYRLEEKDIYLSHMSAANYVMLSFHASRFFSVPSLYNNGFGQY